MYQDFWSNLIILGIIGDLYISKLLDNFKMYQDFRSNRYRKLYNLWHIVMDRTIFAVFQTVIYSSFLTKELYILLFESIDSHRTWKSLSRFITFIRAVKCQYLWSNLIILRIIGDLYISKLWSNLKYVRIFRVTKISCLSNHTTINIY